MSTLGDSKMRMPPRSEFDRKVCRQTLRILGSEGIFIGDYVYDLDPRRCIYIHECFFSISQEIFLKKYYT